MSNRTHPARLSPRLDAPVSRPRYSCADATDAAHRSRTCSTGPATQSACDIGDNAASRWLSQSWRCGFSSMLVPVSSRRRGRGVVIRSADTAGLDSASAIRNRPGVDRHRPGESGRPRLAKHSCSRNRNGEANGRAGRPVGEHRLAGIGDSTSDERIAAGEAIVGFGSVAFSGTMLRVGQVTPVCHTAVV